jgi:hypothetical protein
VLTMATHIVLTISLLVLLGKIRGGKSEASPYMTDEGPGDDPWTPSWFWKDRSPIPPPEAKTSLSIEELKHLPNFFVTGNSEADVVEFNNN